MHCCHAPRRPSAQDTPTSALGLLERACLTTHSLIEQALQEQPLYVAEGSRQATATPHRTSITAAQPQQLKRLRAFVVAEVSRITELFSFETLCSFTFTRE